MYGRDRMILMARRCRASRRFVSVMERVDHAGEAYSNRGRMKDL